MVSGGNLNFRNFARHSAPFMKLRIILFLLFLCPLFLPNQSCPAQNQHKIDSLQSALAKSAADTNRINILAALSWEISYLNLSEGLTYGEQAEKLAEKLQFYTGLGNAYHDLGSIYLDMGDLEKANTYLYKELQLIESQKASGSRPGGE